MVTLRVKISVVLPAHYERERLGAAVESILRQTEDALENAHVVVIDVHAWPPDRPDHTPHQHHSLDLVLDPGDVCPPIDDEPEPPG